MVEPGGALRLFDSVRRHALEGLAAGGGEAQARARHLAWLPPLRNEVDNLRAALHAGLDGTPPPAVRDDALRLVAASAMFWVRSGLRLDGLCWFAAMRACIEPGWGPLQRRYLDMLEGFALRDQGDFDGYRSTCASVAQRCRAVGANAEAWPAENAQGQAVALQGRLDEACTLLARTVYDVRAAGRLREQVPVVAIAASLHLQRGTDAAALALAA